MANEELIMHAREFTESPNLGKDMARELDNALIYIRELADIAEAAEALVKELEAGEWEYRARSDYGRVIAQGSFDDVASIACHRLERRRRAGDWLPVESEGE